MARDLREWIRRQMMAAAVRAQGGYPTLPGMRRQPGLSYAPGVEIFTSPAMGGEGLQVGNRVYLGEGYDYPLLAHELEHVEQTRRLGPLYPWADILMSRIGVPYTRNPFERAAVAREAQARAASRKARR